jgi:hypothetical protein
LIDFVYFLQIWLIRRKKFHLKSIKIAIFSVLQGKSLFSIIFDDFATFDFLPKKIFFWRFLAKFDEFLGPRQKICFSKKSHVIYSSKLQKYFSDSPWMETEVKKENFAVKIDI